MLRVSKSKSRIQTTKFKEKDTKGIRKLVVEKRNIGKRNAYARYAGIDCEREKFYFSLRSNQSGHRF